MDEEKEEIIEASKKRKRLQSNFICSHIDERNICRRSYEPCTGPLCQFYESCGECRSYHIPASQEPCRSCMKGERDD